MGVFEEWEAGALTDREALRTIWSDLREIEDPIAALDRERERLRDQISQIVARTGPISLPGLGSAQITAPSVAVTYDRQRLERLVSEIARSYPELAARIVACRREQERSGGLRIVPEWPKQ